LELHTLRCDAIESFCAELRAHAAREDAMAYPQANVLLAEDLVRKIATRIRKTVGGLSRTEKRGIGATAGRP
jgi:hypothetical protein